MTTRTGTEARLPPVAPEEAPVGHAVFAWPTLRLVGAILGAGGFSAAAWSVAGAIQDGRSLAAAGAAGTLLVAGVALAILLASRPWRPRRVADWATVWLGGTVARLLVVPPAAYLLYSATSLSGGTLALAVGFAYVLTLIAEATVLALHVRRAG